MKTKTQFKEAISYIRESKSYIYFATALFFAFVALGFALKEQLSFLDPLIKSILNQVSGLNTIELIFFILQNNFQVAFISIILGALLGIFNLPILIVNGLIIGYVSAKVQSIEGILALWGLLPHGIFELPAIFISFGLGIKLGASLFSRKNPIKKFKERFYKSMNSLLMVILPLLIIAAIIEGLLIALVWR